MSSLAYGCETWVLQDQQAKSHVHSSVMKLYRRLQGVAHCQHVSDEMILSQCEVPSPTEFLRRARLRYLGTLYRGASTADWGIVNSDLQWLLLLQDNFNIVVRLKILVNTVLHGSTSCNFILSTGSVWSIEE